MRAAVDWPLILGLTEMNLPPLLVGLTAVVNGLAAAGLVWSITSLPPERILGEKFTYRQLKSIKKFGKRTS